MTLQAVEDSRTDDEIIAASIGEPEQFTIVFKRSVDSIYTFVRRRCTESATEDIVSEVYLRGFKTRLSFDPAKGEFRGFLFGIATNVLREFYRDVARQRALPYYRELDDAETQALDRMAASSGNDHLVAAMSSLPHLDREALQLRICEGLSYEQIAERVDAPIGTVRSRIARARSRVKEEMEPVLGVTS